MINKIHPDLLGKVSILGTNTIDCFLHATNFAQVQNLLDSFNINYIPYPFMNCFFAHIPAHKIMEFSNFQCVNYITKSAKVFTLVDRAKQFMNLNALPPISNPPTIAFIDTGIAPHLDFLLPFPRVVHFKDFINHQTRPYDDNGHGTFISGVCCGSGLCSNFKYSGIVPNANIVMIKALDSLGETNSKIIIDAMQYIYDIRDRYNIKVVCMSFGADYSGTNDPLQKGALALWNSGLIVVAAAGNSGPSGKSIKSPGTSSRIITVGGLDDGRNDNIVKIADFSSRGPAESKFKPDIVAPSVNITSTSNLFKQGPYTSMSGTSVATPMIAGICALLSSNHPNYSPDKIKHALLNMCTPLTHNKNDEGFGYIKFD
ncbi:MAG: S8 family peptidase [Clostridia bacterium]|nr:S8 family peptidase [Clostridia bacterium]